jgi:cation transport protein ChaC
VSGLSEDDIAGVLCRAAGHWGTGAEYLLQTVDQLEQLGIRDVNLWRLQKRVAHRLLALQSAMPFA